LGEKMDREVTQLKTAAILNYDDRNFLFKKTFRSTLIPYLFSEWETPL
jgi:hypothetical protein